MRNIADDLNSVRFLVCRYRRDAPCPAYAVSNHVRVDKMQDKTRWDIMRMAATSCKSTGTEPSKESETLAVILTFLLSKSQTRAFQSFQAFISDFNYCQTLGAVTGSTSR